MDKQRLGELIDLIGTIGLGDKESRSKDIMSDEILMNISRELVESIHKSVTIDWTMRENVQAKMRVKIKKILRKYGYPPDKQQKATDTVIEQAKLLCKDLTSNN